MAFVNTPNRNVEVLGLGRDDAGHSSFRIRLSGPIV